MKKILLALLLLPLMAGATIPSGYYTPVKGKAGADLKAALQKLLYNHTQVSSYSDLPKYFQKTDVYPVGDPKHGQWWEMYGNIPIYLPSFYGMHREHSFPKSWWGGSTTTPAYVDLFHLYPAEAEANLAKSNYPLGEVQTWKFDNGVTKVGYPVAGQGGGAQQVFEPADVYKGDFARTYFYFVTTYSNLQWKYTYMVSQGAYPTLNKWSLDLLLKWHRMDPVSQKEIDRNEQVYKVQFNRNPFIDFPDLPEYIWGSKTLVPFDPGTAGGEVVTPSGDPELITPVQNQALDFGDVAMGSTTMAELFFRGQNLQGTLELMIYKGDTQAFSITTRSIGSAAANSDEGYALKVTFAPVKEGKNTARLLISDGGLPGSTGIDLIGYGHAVPTLTQLTATAATDVSATAYTARWDAAPQEEVVDYYSVTRTRYIDSPYQVEELVAETNDLLIDDCEPGTSESYHVRSARLGYFSTPSNEIWVELAAGISSVSAEQQPLRANPCDGGVTLATPVEHSNIRVYDTAGRMVAQMARGGNGTFVALGTGAYLMVTDQTARPLRLLVP